MNKSNVIFLILMLQVSLLAQIITEETMFTDSIDIFSVQEDTGRSSALALAQTLLLPGLGHRYMGQEKRAFAYFATDMALLFGGIFFESYSQRIFDNSRTFAMTYASVEGGSGADDIYWRTIAHFDDADGYNHAMENNRNPSEKYDELNLQWVWLDESYREEYGDYRKNANRYHVVSTFFLGAMFLNRVVSFIDLRASTKHRGIRGHSSLKFYPYLAFENDSYGLLVSSDF